MSFVTYLRLARPDYWMKNVFVLPGILLAFFFHRSLFESPPWICMALGIVATCLVASSNYVLNEILDASYDRAHPEKRHRPLAAGTANPALAWIEWAVLAAMGAAVALAVDVHFAMAAAALWIMGIVYNVPPIRTKEWPYLDVLSEAINNPIRLALGWYSTGVSGMPPVSVVFSYWMFGSFLMAVKRLAEFRHIGDGATAGDYRRSFKHYDEERLLVSIVFYAAFFALSAGVFMARYRPELVVAVPLVAFSLAHYLHIGFATNSAAQHPERLLREPRLMTSVMITFGACAALLFIDLPTLEAMFAILAVRE